MQKKARGRSREPMRSPPLLMTKIHPPPFREQTIARTRLVEKLRTGRGCKLTVVAAPAGYGKTTLLGTWRELDEATLPIAWLSLDEGDNDPVVLWSYVIMALNGVCPSLDVSMSSDLIGPARVEDAVLPNLINELAELGDAALVLDDFHHISSGPARESIVWFIDHVPSTFRLVLATRSEPALPLPSLRAHGSLLELRARDLGFTRDEANALLNDRLELGIESEGVDNLVDRTEGWPAGVYLAALSLQATENRQAVVSSFDARTRTVVNFLVDEVLDAHDPETQTLMLRSSILERLCGPLCDAVLGREGSSAGLLEALSRANLFLLPLDDRGEWYRFHHLFAQLLRVELEHREGGVTRELHRRAFAWYRENGSVEEAIEHALEGGLYAEAAELIAATWIDYVNENRYRTVLAWLERFPADTRDDPVLLLVEAWVRTLYGGREAGERAIAAVERHGGLDAGPLPDGFSSRQASLCTLRAVVTWGDTGAGIENARRAAALEGPESPWRPVVSFALGANLYFSGELEEADRWLEEAAELAPSCKQWLIAESSLAYRSLVAGEQGRLDEQAALAEAAIQVVRQPARDDVEGEVFTALGETRAVQGKLDQALAYFVRAADSLRFRRHPRSIADALIRQAAVLQALGRRESAAAVIAEARSMVDACPDPRVLADRLAALEQPQPTRRRSGDGILSAREFVILRMLTGKLTERDIGRELYLSHNTIHSHTRSIYRKLGASSRSEALENARGLGLI